MEWIRLTKNEKRLLRNIALGLSYFPEGMGAASVSACADALERDGLIRGAWASGHELVDATLTSHGAMYLQENPHLRNPIEWSKVAAIAAILGAVAVIAGLLIACRNCYN